MPTKQTITAIILSIFAFFLLLPASASAQTSNVAPRITAAVDETKLTMLRGNTHPLARAKYDRGPVEANFSMGSMLLVLKRSPEQETALEKLLAEQQDQSSPNYHKWLTPSEFGSEFGPSDQDIQTIKSWLESHGFQVQNVSNGRTVIEFSGTAAQVQEALHTSIHQYVVNGAEHFANSSDPSIPTALTPAVAGVRSLHNFFPKPMHRVSGIVPRSNAAKPKPQYTFPNPCSLTNQNNLCNFALGPTDFATIYNVQQLWNSGIDGTGQSISIVGDSNINPIDVTDFRTMFAMPPNPPTVIVPTVIPGCGDPGLQPNGDEIEAILDVEWAGAVARNANISLVTCASLGSTFGGDLAAQYIIDDQTPRPSVLGESFGDCELDLGQIANAMYNTLWGQAAAEGITVLVSTGDNGSAGCDITEVNGPPTEPAQLGLEVNGIASTPNDVAVGGTEFNDVTNPFTYFTQANAANTGASAIMYIPETTWNDTCTNSVVYGAFSFSSAAAACNSVTVQQDGFVVPVGGSGGMSNCTTYNGNNPLNCTGGYSKPTWQNTITPGDGKRDIPDISLFAGDGTISGSFYIVCERDYPGGVNGQCSLSLTSPNFLEVGGTSVSTQVFAGMMALVDQKSEESQGNANTVLYPLFTSTSGSSIYHSILASTNAMPCEASSPNCNVPAGCTVSAFVLKPPKPPAGPGLPGAGLMVTLGVFSFSLLLLASRYQKRRWISAFALVFAILMLDAGCGGGSSSSGSTSTPCSIGILSGYSSTGSGYNLATGLGSVNTATLVNATNKAVSGGWATSTNGVDFTLSLNSSTVSIPTPGGSNNGTILTVTPNGGFNSAVILSCSDLPAGMTCSNFTQNPVPGIGSPIITISTTAATIPGTYVILITGQTAGGAIQRSVAVTVTVV